MQTVKISICAFELEDVPLACIPRDHIVGVPHVLQQAEAECRDAWLHELLEVVPEIREKRRKGQTAGEESE